MLGQGTRDTVASELGKIRRYDWKAWFAALGDYVVRGITAGLSAKELQAILRGDAPTEKPNPRYKLQVKSFIMHIRPKYYQRGSTWFTHTWRLGWFSTYFFVVETVTGIILMLFYAPTPEEAYGDMLYILSGVPYGELMRDLHRLGAEGMVATVILHMVRVYFTGSYKAERAFTWFTGVILLLVTLLLSFSGYLLPWDQLAYWAVTIGTSMAEAAPLVGMEVNLLLRGALDIWSDGLLRFYLLHVLLMPLLAIVFISIHYYKVAREHSISLPASVSEGTMDKEEKKHQEERIDLIPNLIIHELMLSAVTLLLMVAAAITFYDAPLEQHADPQVTPLHTEAPWYFLWLQGMLKLGDKTLMGIILPTLIFALLFVVPWIDRNPHRLARRRPVAVAIGVLTTISFLVMTYMGTPTYGIETPPAQNILSHLVPMTHPGPFRGLHWEEIETAEGGEKRTYYVSFPPAMADNPQFADPDKHVFIDTLEESPSDTDFIALMKEFKAEVEEQAKLIPPADPSQALAVVTIEEIQPGLKWSVFTITWDEIVLDPDGSATFAIPYETHEVDIDGNVVMDAEGNPKAVTAKATVHGLTLDDSGQPAEGSEPVAKFLGRTEAFGDDGEIAFTDAAGLEQTIRLSDAVLNINRNNKQVQATALHEDSRYKH